MDSINKLQFDRVRDALAHFSWFQYGETPEDNRVSDHVPRKEIYKLLTHAGLVRRQEYSNSVNEYPTSYTLHTSHNDFPYA